MPELWIWVLDQINNEYGEKNQIKEIYDQLPKIDDSINFKLLEENYNSLNEFQEVKSLPIISEEDRTIFSQIKKIKEK